MWVVNQFSVLFNCSGHLYSSHLRKLLNRLTKFSKKFLSNGFEVSNSAKVTWSYVCKPFRQCGHEITDIGIQNKTNIVRHIWLLFDSKDNSLWTMWVHKYLLKGKYFGISRFIHLALAFWYWRKNLKTQGEAKPFVEHIIGNGENAFLGFDYWLPSLIGMVSESQISQNTLKWVLLSLKMERICQALIQVI